jgi:hypothetical protein
MELSALHANRRETRRQRTAHSPATRRTMPAMGALYAVGIVLFQGELLVGLLVSGYPENHTFPVPVLHLFIRTIKWPHIKAAWKWKQLRNIFNNNFDLYDFRSMEVLFYFLFWLPAFLIIFSSLSVTMKCKVFIRSVFNAMNEV